MSLITITIVVIVQCPRNPMYIITMDVCIRLGVLQKGKATLGPWHIQSVQSITLVMVRREVHLG